MSNKITGSVMLSIAASFAVTVGAMNVLGGVQDPAPQNPAPTKQTTTSKRRTTTKQSKQPTTNTEATGDQTPASTMPPSPTQTEPATAAAQVSAPSSPTEQTDLSGTYTGVFNCDALGLTGDTTLTITGNQFTTADGKTGRIVASTTRGYTAVALQLGDTPTTPSANAATTTSMTPPTIISLRGRKSGNRLTLSPVSGGQPCSFTTGSKVASRRTRRSTQPMPAPSGAEVASPAEAGPSPADVTGPAKPSKKTRRSTQRTEQPQTMPAPVPVTPTETVPKQEPSPIPPSPTPTPNPSPTPSGSPSPEASPNPSPEASPNPSPSPSPSPAPKRPRN